MFMWLARSW